MAQYFLTVKKPSGRTATEIVEAESAKSAIRTMEDRGCTDIVLHTDDYMAKAMKPIQFTHGLSARVLVLNRTRGRFSRDAHLLLRLYVLMWKFFLLVAVVCLVLRAVDASWTMFAAVLSAAILSPPVLVLTGMSSSALYDRLLEAESWGRSEEVLRLLPRLPAEVPDYTAAWHKAKALAALGSIEEAYHVFMPFADGKAIPQPQFWPLMAAVYRVAGQDDLAIAAWEKPLELEPGNPTLLTGMANILLDVGHDFQHAKDCARRARQEPLSDMTVPSLLMAEGMIALEEGNPRVAVERLAGR